VDSATARGMTGFWFRCAHAPAVTLRSLLLAP
jgi:hypothetical protein